MKLKTLIVILVIAVMPLQEMFTQDCSHGATTSAKGNQLYLYMPTTSDATFPEYNSVITTSPLGDFDIADLDNSVGTTAQIRNRIFEIVTEDYCEFNVEVILNTTSPGTTGVTNWQIVGVSSESYAYGTGWLFGVAMDVDLGDADNQDYARVFAGSFDGAYGGSGGALDGTNSTLERWARAIGHTTTHEAGHNYGLGHCDAGSQTGEDGPRNHIMNTSNPANSGCTFNGVTAEDRASRRRHFSDQSYGLLAHNVGLNIMAVYNWDFINPNADAAHSLVMTLLSTASSLSINHVYLGTRSPWSNPTIAATGGTQSFKGTTYNVFTLTFSVAKSWNGGSDGIVPGGAEFHIGANFHESDPIILYDTKLKDSGGSDLTLNPRMAGFDNGSFDLSTGDFEVAMFNPNPEEGDLEIEDLQIQMLPRLAGINSMLTGEELFGLDGIAIEPYSSDCGSGKPFDLKNKRSFRLGGLSDDRYIDIAYDSTDCNGNSGDGEGVDLNNCAHGYAVGLFPATSVYITATVIQPNAKYFSQEINDYVTGPLKSKVFYQFVGKFPDFDQNGIDDLIDIREGRAIDKNGNGVIDKVEPDEDKPTTPPTKEYPWWYYIIFIILIFIIIVQYIRRRKG